jgi:serine/threonine protein kinase
MSEPAARAALRYALERCWIQALPAGDPQVALQALLTHAAPAARAELEQAYRRCGEAEAERIGPYEVERELARGGMGVVYVARHAELGRRVALKLMLGELAEGDEMARRFALEGQAVARLRHPNVVTIHELGVHRGQPYQAMELIEGESLKARLSREGPLPLLEAAACVEAVSRGVAAAHAQGILHRDVKPANVLREAGSGRVLLTDFGLARDEESARDRLTRTGEILGTPSYMPPEQAGGARLGPAADVYSLGATLYALVCGQAPFVGAPLNVITALLTQPPSPPRALRADLDPDLERVILLCLEKDPQDRYASAEALADDLARYARGEPVAARPLSAWALFRRRLRARRGQALFSAAMVSLLVAGLGSTYAFLRWQRSAPPPEVALAPPTFSRVFEAWLENPDPLAGRLDELQIEIDEDPQADPQARSTARRLLALLRGEAPAETDSPSRGPGSRILRLGLAARDPRLAVTLAAASWTFDLDTLPLEPLEWLANVAMQGPASDRLGPLRAKLEDRRAELSLRGALTLQALRALKGESVARPEAPSTPWSRDAWAQVKVLSDVEAIRETGNPRGGLPAFRMGGVALRAGRRPARAFPLTRVVARRAWEALRTFPPGVGRPQPRGKCVVPLARLVLLAPPKVRHQQVQNVYDALAKFHDSPYVGAALGVLSGSDIPHLARRSALRILAYANVSDSICAASVPLLRLVLAQRLIPNASRERALEILYRGCLAGVELTLDPLSLPVSARVRKALEALVGLLANSTSGLGLVRRARANLLLGNLQAAAGDANLARGHLESVAAGHYLLTLIAHRRQVGVLRLALEAAKHVRPEDYKAVLNLGLLVWDHRPRQDDGRLSATLEALKGLVEKGKTGKVLGMGWPLRCLSLEFTRLPIRGQERRLQVAIKALEPWAPARVRVRGRLVHVPSKDPRIRRRIEWLKRLGRAQEHLRGGDAKAASGLVLEVVSALEKERLRRGRWADTP